MKEPLSGLHRTQLVGGGEAAALHHAHEHRDVRQVFHGRHSSIIANNLIP
jgi:hypothetical protein